MSPYTEHAAGVLDFALFDARNTRRLFQLASAAEGWEDARVHRSSGARAEDGAVDRGIRSASILGLPRDEALFRRLDASVRRTVLPLVRDFWGLRLSDHRGAQIVRYAPGGHYRPHADRGAAFMDRLFTVVCYLNDDFAGGTTRFPELGLCVTPRTGRAILFPSEYVHGAEPVTAGCKYVLVTWLIAPPMVQWI